MSNCRFVKSEFSPAFYTARDIKVPCTILEGSGLCYHKAIIYIDGAGVPSYGDNYTITQITSGWSVTGYIRKFNFKQVRQAIQVIAPLCNWTKPVTEATTRIEDRSSLFSKVRAALDAIEEAEEKEAA